MSVQFAEVRIRFRLCPILAAVLIVGLWPFGVAFGVMGSIFGGGLLLMVAALGLPRSIDLNFGFMLGLATFAAQFLGSVFLGMEAGLSTTTAVFGTVILWFLQLAVFGLDIHRGVQTVLVQPARQAAEAEAEETAGTGA